MVHERPTQLGNATLTAKTYPDLTHEDVAKLLADPSPETRASLAPKMADKMNAPLLTDEERRIAHDIVRLMAKDASLYVREALAEAVKSSPDLPHDVAMTLASDIDSVALPVLEFSEVLTDADLVELVRRTSGEEKQVAVARRAHLSDLVADALIDTDNAHVVRALVANDGAMMSESTLDKVVDRFGDDAAIQEPLAHRAHLPITIAERLVAKVSDHLRDYLMTRPDLSGDAVHDLVTGARERVTVDLATYSEEPEVDRMIAQLKATDRLTGSLVLRALCIGNVVFFESALAAMAGIPTMNARLLIHDAGQLGFRSLYKKAGLPESMYPVFHTAVKMAVQTDFRGADYDPTTYSRTVMERVLSDTEESMPSEDADYLLAKLQDLAADAAR